MISWLLVPIYLVFLGFLGMAFCKGFLWKSERFSAELWLPISFGLGLGVQAIAFFLSLILIGKVSFLLSIILIGVSLGALYGFRFYCKDEASFEFGGWDFPGPESSKGERNLCFAIAALLIFFLGITFTNAAQYPFTSYDGRAIWSYKAKVLFYEDTVFTEAFTDPLRVHYHRDYPLMIPFAEYVIYRIVGDIGERQVRLLFSATFVFTVLFIYGGLRRLGIKSLLAILAAFFYCATPFRDDWSERDGGALNSGAVDLPLAFFALVSIVSYLLWWRERKHWQWVVGVLFSAFCFMIKKEGLVIFAVTSAANGVMALFSGSEFRKKNILAVIGFAVLTLVVASPWFMVVKQLPNYYDEDYAEMFNAEVLTTMHTRLNVIFYTLNKEIWNVEKWNLYWVALVLCFPFFVFGWFSRREYYLDVILIAWMMSYLFVYMVSPLNLVYHLNTSTSRLASHFLPVVLFRLILFFALRNPLIEYKEKGEVYC